MSEALLTLLGWAIAFSTSTIVFSMLGWCGAKVVYRHSKHEDKFTDSWTSMGAAFGFMVPATYLWFMAVNWAWDIIK